MKNAGDSIEVAKITSVASNGEDCGCVNSRVFTITNELWYNKKVGDQLYFDYIRKSRFFKVVNDQDRIDAVLGKVSTLSEPTQSTIAQPVISTTSDLEAERKILELERQKMQIELELEKLKSK